MLMAKFPLEPKRLIRMRNGLKERIERTRSLLQPIASFLIQLELRAELGANGCAVRSCFAIDSAIDGYAG